MNNLALTLPGQVIDIAVKRSRRKTLALHILDDGAVEVRAPLKLAWRDIHQFIDSRRNWLNDQLERHEPAPAFRHGVCQPFLGESYPLVLCPGTRRHTWLYEGELVLAGASGRPECEVRKQLEAWYRAQAEALLPAMIESFRAQSTKDWPYQGYRMRKMRARWGSCSRDGEICLNTLLVKYPVAAIEMVIAHEFCHLVHFDHSAAFYALLDEEMPDWRARELLLNR